MKPASIVILGAGVAGLQCALRLSDKLGKNAAQIMLIDKNSHHVLHSTLYDVLTPKISSSEHGFALSKIIADQPITFLHDLVESIDAEHRTVRLHKGGQLNYDYLVIALGSKTSAGQIDGLFDHAYQFDSLPDAIRLRQQLTHLINKKSVPRVLIGGAGMTGIELAAYLATAYSAKIHLNLIETNPHILGGHSRTLSSSIEKDLQRLNIGIYAGQHIKQIKDDKVILANSQSIPYDLLIWTAGKEAPKLLSRSGFAVDRQGRVKVASTLQVEGYSRVYVAGDAAHMSNGRDASESGLPQLHWYAYKSGQAVADNLLRQLKDQHPKPFKISRPPLYIRLGSHQVYALHGHKWLKGPALRRAQQLGENLYLSEIVPYRIKI